MKTSRRAMALLVIGLLSLSLTAIASAQDATPETTAEASTGTPITADNAALLTVFAQNTELNGTTCALAWSPYSEVVVIGTVEGTVVSEVGPSVTGREPFTIRETNSPIVAVSPEGSSLALADENVVRFVQTETLTLALDVTDAQGTIRAFAYSPDGRTFASVGAEGILRLYNFTTETLALVSEVNVAEAAGDDAPFASDLFSIAFSPDGSQIAVGGGLIFVFDLAGTLTRTITLSESNLQFPIVTLAYAPDGTHLAAGQGNSAYWVDVTTGDVLYDLDDEVENYTVTSVSITPDGSLIASADGPYIRLWSTEAGEAITALGPLETYRCSLAFSPDGTTLAAGNNAPSGEVLFWRVEAP